MTDGSSAHIDDSDRRTLVSVQVVRTTTEIDAVVAGIIGITDQTNVPARNGSLEASGAADSDGLAVVADQFESLAAESQSYAEESETILTDIRPAADTTDRELDAALAEVDQNTDEVFGASYAGAADQVLELTGDDGNRAIAFRQSPTGSTAPYPLAPGSTAVSAHGD